MIRLIILFVFVSVGYGSSQDTGTHEPKRILFVGNSLTYTNNLPEIVKELGKANGMEIKVEMLAVPNYGLEDHWNGRKLQKLIRSGNFDFVVVQQGPSSQMEGRTMLLEYGKKIKSLCKKSEVQLAFFMVWPARMNYGTFDGVIRNYTDAANETGSLLCPVGRTWKAYFDATNDFSYYGPDGFHPSRKGSEAAAKVIYETLFPNV